MLLKLRNWPNLTSKAQAIALLLVAFCFFALLNCVLRKFSQMLDPFVIVGYRSLFSLILILIALPFLKIKKQIFRDFSRINIFKAIVDFISLPLWITAIAHMQMTQVVSISFLTPIISAILAAIFLKDRMPFFKWIACIMGFAGAYIVVNPSKGLFNYYSLFVLATCVLWASSGTMIKTLTNRQQHPIIIMLYSNTLLLIMSLPFFMKSGRWLSLNEFFFAVLMAFLACGANLSFNTAYKKTKVTNLIPFEYLRLVITTGLAFMFFGELISVKTVVGSAIILFASFWIANIKSH